MPSAGQFPTVPWTCRNRRLIGSFRESHASRTLRSGPSRTAHIDRLVRHSSRRCRSFGLPKNAVARFDPNALWPTHPMDDRGTPILTACSISVQQASSTRCVGWRPRPRRSLRARSSRRSRRCSSATRVRTRMWDEEVPSLLMGDVGILLLQWQVARRAPSPMRSSVRWSEPAQSHARAAIGCRRARCWRPSTCSKGPASGAGATC